ncbi:MAG: DNA polymerase I [Pseudomonadales bacterium]|nr:DNA polymerase I [Pseudomonadales bacterium]
MSKDTTDTTDTTNPPFILVDGSSYLYRAFHALPELKTSKNQPTGAIKGVLNMLNKLVRDYQPELMAEVFDAKGKTFRNDLYEEYKANRPPMPDDLRSQIAPLHDLVRAMGFPLLMVDGVEADDVIGTLATLATEKKINTLISTGDKDMAQLVNEHVTLVNTMTDTVMGEEGVKEKFGVAPNQIIDYLTLMGDTSDNIPGVPKVGPKTAVKWLQEYQTLDGVIENAQKIKGKVGESLCNSLDQLPLSKLLATIKCDVGLDAEPDELLLERADKNKLIEYYTEFEFKSWLQELLSGEAEQGELDTSKIDVSSFEIITCEKRLDEWISILNKAKLFAFDTETTSLNYMKAEVVWVSFSVGDGKAAYVPCGHDYLDAPDQLSRELVLSKLKPLLEGDEKKIVGQNLKYDMNVLVNHDIHLRGIAFDTMLESYILDSIATRHDMDSLSLKYLGHNTIHFEDIAGKGKKQLTFNEIAVEVAGPYAAEDAEVTMALHNALWSKLQLEKSLTTILEDFELPLIPILSKIERTGALIDADMLRLQSQQLAVRIKELEEDAHELAGEVFNIGSPKQLGAILYEKLAIPVLKKTPKGAPSTAEPVLQELALDYPLPKVVLEYRSLSKLKSTYTDKLPEMIDPSTKRIHTSYHQAVAATGRLSSSDPNLQNIPVRTEEGRRIRQAFIPASDCKLVAADYSQIELRIMAHLSGDKGLLSAFSEGLDIHKVTASEVFGVSVEQVSTEQRRNAKAVNFGLIYGMSAFGLGKQLGIGRNQAQEYMDSYFQHYPGVLAYMEEIRATAAKQGYVETLFGRRLYLPEINSRNVPRRQGAERTAINAPMQGTAADIIKKAMIATDEFLSRGEYKSKMIMQVHDELVLEVPESELEKVIAGIKHCMESAASLDVPLIVDVGVGDNWDEAH